MIKPTLDILLKTFPLEPIPQVADICDSNGDDVRDDLSILIGRRWNELTPIDFRFHFEVFCWLTPIAFRYYCPAVIYCSEEELAGKQKLEHTSLVVDYLLTTLIPTPNAEFQQRYAAQWSMFSKDQLDLVCEWISTLSFFKSTMPCDKPLLISAIGNLKQKLNRQL